MNFKDYYVILDVPEQADTKTIRKAYRQLALETHPDVSISESAHEKFIELNEAYTVLKDPFRRKKYDELLGSRRNPDLIQVYPPSYPKWESKVRKAAARGRKKGEKYAKESDRKFEVRMFWWVLEIMGELAMRVLFWLVESILHSISS